MLVNAELKRQHKRIEDLINEVKLKFEPDDELQSHLAKYICVMCSGFLENAMYHTLHDIVKLETSSEMVTAYVKSHLLKIQNPNARKIRDIFKCFKSEWFDELGDYMQKEQRSEAVNYIMKDRHNIAHGKDSNITITKIETYFNKAVEVIAYIEANFVKIAT